MVLFFRNPVDSEEEKYSGSDDTGLLFMPVGNDRRDLGTVHILRHPCPHRAIKDSIFHRGEKT